MAEEQVEKVDRRGWRKGQKGQLAKKDGSGEKVVMKQLDSFEKTAILRFHKEGKSLAEISRLLNRPSSTIVRFVGKMNDTRELAAATLAAGALTLAERIVKQADVDQAIEVLSRPGIDVMAPPKVESKSGAVSLQVSVGVASCGTVVKVEAASNESVSALPDVQERALPVQGGVERPVIEGKVE